MRMKRRGVEMRLIIDGDAASSGPRRSTAAQRDRPCVSMVQRSAGGPGAIDRRDRQARTSYGPSRAARDAAGVSGAQDRRGDRRRPPARRPQHHSDDPKNRTAPALERAAASSGHPIDSRGRSCLRYGVLPKYVRVPARCRPVRRWTCQNREQRILSDFRASAAAGWHSPGPPPRVNRAPRADFIASPKCRETCQTVWRRGRDSNPRYRLPSTPD